MLQDSFSTAVPRHPDPLMRSALTADASCTYAAFVPCWRSSRGVAVKADSNLSDHS
jgi:hypothetical protein